MRIKSGKLRSNSALKMLFLLRKQYLFYLDIELLKNGRRLSLPWIQKPTKSNNSKMIKLIFSSVILSGSKIAYTLSMEMKDSLVINSRTILLNLNS